jgi:hypothetical protein
VVFGWLAAIFGKGSGSTEPDQDPMVVKWEPAGEYGKVKQYLPDIPDGHQIYVGFKVAGITFRKDDAEIFANSRDQTLELELDPTNQKDRNAIKVMGVCNHGRAHIGFVPKEIAAQIAKCGMFDVLRTRLDRIFWSDKEPDPRFPRPYIEIQMQLTGPKSRIDEWRPKPKARKQKTVSQST